MPRYPGIVNNEFEPVETDTRSPMVQCRHCKQGRVTKASAKRKVTHLKRCEAYKHFLVQNGQRMPVFNGEDDDNDSEPPDSGMRKVQVEGVPYRWPATGTFKTEDTAMVVLDMQRDFCEPSGLLAHLGHPISAARSIIPPISRLLHICRSKGVPVYHVRHSHRHDLSTFSQTERARAEAVAAALQAKIVRSQTSQSAQQSCPSLSFPLPGTSGPMGHFLLRQSPGTEPVSELCPIYQEVVIDHPKPSAFAYTDLDLLLRNRDVRNLIIVGLDVSASVTSTVRDATDRGFDCALVQGCIARVSTLVPRNSKETVDSAADMTTSSYAPLAALNAVLPTDWSTSTGSGTTTSYLDMHVALVELAARPPPAPQSLAVFVPSTHTQVTTTSSTPGEHTVFNATRSPPFIAPPAATTPRRGRPPGRPPLSRLAIPDGYQLRRKRGMDDPIFYVPPNSIPHPHRTKKLQKIRPGALVMLPDQATNQMRWYSNDDQTVPQLTGIEMAARDSGRPDADKAGQDQAAAIDELDDGDRKDVETLEMSDTDGAEESELVDSTPGMGAEGGDVMSDALDDEVDDDMDGLDGVDE